MGTRSFWRTYNLISIIATAGMGVAFIVGGLLIPIVRAGFILGGLVCFAVAGMLAAWHLFSRDLIPDVPMMGPGASFAAMANASANANAMTAAVAGISPFPVQQVQQWLPGQARVDRADDTGFASPLGRTVDLHLTVTLPGRTPYQVMVREVVPAVAESAIVPGSVLGVRADPNNRHQMIVGLPGR